MIIKKVFEFKKGQFWDGDEAIIHFIEYHLLSGKGKNCNDIKQDTKITLVCEKSLPKNIPHFCNACAGDLWLDNGNKNYVYWKGVYYCRECFTQGKHKGDRK